MFRFIDRAQRQVVRQNHELAATNALSSAVQGEVGVNRIVDVALESLLSTSGAMRASVTIFSGEDRSSDGADVTRQLLAVPGSALLVPDDPGGSDAPIIDFPLSTGAVTVGRMQLWLPVGAGAGDRLASGTLQNIGHQLASAIQLAQLFADLERKNHEGHAFHDILLQVSNQGLPADILGSVVRHARDLMGSDEAVLCLDEDASRSVQFAGTLGGPASFGDGPVCITSDDGLRNNVHGHDVACPLRSSPEWKTNMAVPILGPMGKLGELWIGRRSDAPFTERDRAFLVALSGLAAIAITSVRMRESGRQRAVLAERERIAREMHDSLAQVLGVTHLRLRALDSREEVKDNPAVAVELAELADICEEAYRDVREAILGLSASNKSAQRAAGHPQHVPGQVQPAVRHRDVVGERPGPRAVPVAALRGPGDPGHPGGADERPQALGSEVGGRPHHRVRLDDDLRRGGRRSRLRPRRLADRPRRVRDVHHARTDGPAQR